MATEDNKTITSLDPRISRSNLTGGNHSDVDGLIHFQTYEVFHQSKRGAQHKHVGIVHAPNPDMALLYAKEQYARREVTANIWVAPSSCISATEYEDDDIFTTAPEKLYRNPASYKVMDRIQAFKERGMKASDEV
ncbi:MAG: ring-1,2-phenylacetyl-CoA epoxidase subunit PaaB [Bacteroidia bacterium]|mgnify:FL=1|jgi:ring-1,2-phenylacetyl-CoA epoxidase subunit PaaB|tara:strand:+ start:3379 stop:3783 length:405 start_codon:yes stop_codon:yes gene_type:complete